MSKDISPLGLIISGLGRVKVGLKRIRILTYLEENFKQIIIGPELWNKSLEGETIRNFYNRSYSLSPNFTQDLLNYNVKETAQKVTKPFLIIHGQKDTAVPFEHSSDLYNALKSKDKQNIQCEDEGHLFSENIFQLITDWFNQRFKKS